MESTSATALLRADHRVIEQVLDSLDAAVAGMERGEEVPTETLRKAIEFSQTFVDRCHHGKEESCLFPCLEKRGIPREGGPIGMMLYEHQVGRELVAKIQAILSEYQEGRSDSGAVARLCADYTAHIRQHIFKEENALFRMGEEVMEEEDHSSSRSCFEKTEEERVGKEKHEEMHRLADEMGRSAREGTVS